MLGGYGFDPGLDNPVSLGSIGARFRIREASK